MKTRVHEVLPTCDNPTTKKPEKVGHPSPFEISSDAYLIRGYEERLWKLHAADEPYETIDTDPSEARKQYKELNSWNRESHNELVEILEEAYVGLADRVAEYAVNNQQQLERECRQTHLVEVPYALASLPPNLFDHRGEPFIPDTDEEIVRLVSEYMFFNRQLSKQRGGLGKDYDHPFMGSVASRGFDVVLELQRRRDRNDQMFTTEKGQRGWEQYSQAFQRELRISSGSTLAQNATYTTYRNNRRFSEAGGFFEIADGTFESFWLADFNNSSAFTSQIRVPVGWYGPQAAKELALGTYMMMELIHKDVQFMQDAKEIARHPGKRPICQQHLLRSGDRVPAGVDPVEHGIKQTALEGVMSVSATYGGVIEADGIPGYEADLWAGLSATLDQQIPTQITARMPAGFIAAQTIFGNRLKQPMISKDGRIRMRPEADAKLQEIRERRTALHHAMWTAHRESGADNSPPVRFGLYCPFKGEVVKKMAETLMICRAIAHESNYIKPD